MFPGHWTSRLFVDGSLLSVRCLKISCFDVSFWPVVYKRMRNKMRQAEAKYWIALSKNLILRWILCGLNRMLKAIISARESLAPTSPKRSSGKCNFYLFINYFFQGWLTARFGLIGWLPGNITMAHRSSVDVRFIDTFCDRWIPLNSNWSFNERTSSHDEAHKRLNFTAGLGFTSESLNVRVGNWRLNVVVYYCMRHSLIQR